MGRRACPQRGHGNKFVRHGNEGKATYTKPRRRRLRGQISSSLASITARYLPFTCILGASSHNDTLPNALLYFFSFWNLSLSQSSRLYPSHTPARNTDQRSNTGRLDRAMVLLCATSPVLTRRCHRPTRPRDGALPSAIPVVILCDTLALGAMQGASVVIASELADETALRD